MKEKFLSLLGSDLATQEQYFDTLRRSEYLEPEKALLLAVLQDAVASYQKHYSAGHKVGRDRFLEAEQWIMHEGDDWIFSFNNVCELLGLDPKYVRQGIQEWRDKVMAQENPRRHQGLRRQAA